MKKHIFLMMFLCVFVGMVVLGCANRDDATAAKVPEEIENLYQDFMKAGMEGPYSEFASYQHYENHKLKEMGEESFVPIERYEINKWEKLSDNLWVVTNKIKVTENPEEQTYYHFVGQIDGTYFVMVGTSQLPAQLTEGLDLSQYVNTNAIP